MPSISKMLTAGAAAASIATGVSAQDRSGCRVTGSAISNIVVENAVAEAWVDIAAFACADEATAEPTGEEPTGTITTIDAQIHAVARAAAATLAEVNVLCAVQGNARVSTQGSAMVTSRAVAYGEAISNIVASSEVCNRCTAAGDAMVRTSRQLVAEAASNVWIDLALVGTGNSDEVIIQELDVISESISETVEDVLASVTGTIRAGVEDGCSVTAINRVQIGDFIAQCDLDTTGDPDIIENSVVAEVAMEARSFICGEASMRTNITTIAQATARALASAVAHAETFCEANGDEDTMACAFSQSSVDAVARAQATAFAEAFADADTCGCAVEQYIAADAFQEIFAEAAASAYAEACVTGRGSDFDRDFERNVMENMVTATAQVIVSAVSEAVENGEQCAIELLPCASVDQCARANRPCRGPGIDGVIPCCDVNYHCVRRTDTESRCRLRDRPVPSFYDGRPDSVRVCPDVIIEDLEAI